MKFRPGLSLLPSLLKKEEEEEEEEKEEIVK